MAKGVNSPPITLFDSFTRPHLHVFHRVETTVFENGGADRWLLVLWII